jgi:glycosyltransferase involved in cell wall biosynthesis
VSQGFANLGELSRTTLVIIPTHNHASTVSTSIKSVQNQSVEDLDIVVIGDGVQDETRDAVNPLLHDDKRIQFLDLPKGDRNGEKYRDFVIRQSAAQHVTYLGDDDLFFPHHIETLIKTLEGVDFANPLPILINIDGHLSYISTDLAFPTSIAWHLDPNHWRNSVSLTGVMHTRSSYLRLPYGWRPAPTGRWSDHYMWEQYFSLEGFKARTALRSTTAKFAAGERIELSDAERQFEITQFLSRMKDPSFKEEWDDLVIARVRKHSVLTQLKVDRLDREIVELKKTNTSLQQISENVRSDRDQIFNSKSWRITAPLRALRARFFK